MGSSEFNEYVEQSKKINRNIVYVNSICEDEGKSRAWGGAFAVVNNRLKAFLGQETEGLLTVNYQK
jgi:hypothetical protein